MTATATDDALSALQAALVACAAATGPLHDNAVLGSEWATIAATQTFFNLIDGNGDASALIGAGQDAGGGLYEIDHDAELEWVVQASDPVTRRSVFAAGLVAIDDAIRADRTLGGVVSWVEISRVERSNLVTDGAPEIKAAIVTVRLTFTSERPF